MTSTANGGPMLDRPRNGEPSSEAGARCSVEPVDADVMRMPPRDQKQRNIHRQDGKDRPEVNLETQQFSPGFQPGLLQELRQLLAA